MNNLGIQDRIFSELKYLLLMLLIFSTGCATLSPSGHEKRQDGQDFATSGDGSGSLAPIAVEAPTSDKGWWAIRFNINWPEDIDVSWNVDLYLADKIIKPVLNTYRDKLQLWRFHRRAARDEAGHRFSFIFYTTGEVAELIVSAIRNDKQLAIVQQAGEIDEVIYPDTTTISQANISDSSDAAWSAPVKNSWPYYIMGVSEMWLRLVDEIATRDIAKYEFDNYQDILDFYTHVDEEVSNIWRTEGNHAFLHHLNALFGYKETIVIERRYMRF